MAGDILDREEVEAARARARRMILAAFFTQVVLSVLSIFFAIDLLFRRYLVAGPVVAVIAVVALVYAWFYAWVPVRDGKYRRAVVPTLLLGLLGVPFGFIIVGVLYLLAYLRVREVLDQSDDPY